MKEKRDFPLFNSHLDLAHLYWKRLLIPGDWAIDATCGNGHDTAFLAQLLQNEGGIVALDIQIKALDSTRQLLSKQASLSKNIHFFLQSHESFPELAYQKPIRLIVYNLGYLPKGDKKITTQTTSTLKSLEKALPLLLPGGAISLTCYPGHPEGKIEEEHCIHFCKALDPQIWSITFHKWLNRNDSPSFFLIQKNSRL